MNLYLSLYLGYLLIVSVIYYLVKNNYRHIVLATAGIGFIGYISWKAAIYALLFATSNYYFGILIEKFKPKPDLRRRLFWLVIVFDVAFLAYFKYFSSINEAVSNLLSTFTNISALTLNSLIIPIGMSYYTFQALGYIIRINRGSEKPESNYFKFVTYLVFFPKFLSGPVERSNHFFPQIKSPPDFNKTGVIDGSRLFLWGAFKKTVIAYYLYEPVYAVYANVYNYTGAQLIIVFLTQIVYIYMEFSGYTDMALGSAKILGINLIDNFNRPFLGRNISEFWRRWHISLSSWCNDFIYSPFIVKYRQYENFAIVLGVFLTFLTVGIWHALNWTFVVMGLLQAVAIIYEFYTKKIRLSIASRYPKSIVNTFSRIIVFLFMSTSMIFFFAPSISDAIYFIMNLLNFSEGNVANHFIIIHKLPYFIALGFFILIFVSEMFNEKGKNLLSIFLNQPAWLQWLGYAALVVAIYFSDAKFQSFDYMKF